VNDEDEKELHQWRNGHQLGGMMEDLNAMQARAVGAEAKLERIEAILDAYGCDTVSDTELVSSVYRALKGKSCE
jgi:hypothetical protein